MPRYDDHTTEGRRVGLLALQRDAALRRIGRARTWVLAGAAAMTAALAALASALLPGRSLGASTHGRTASTAPKASGSSSTAPALPAPAGPSALGLQGPGQAPEPVPAAPAPSQSAPSSSGYSGAVSGGS